MSVIKNRWNTYKIRFDTLHRCIPSGILNWCESIYYSQHTEYPETQQSVHHQQHVFIFNRTNFVYLYRDFTEQWSISQGINVRTLEYFAFPVVIGLFFGSENKEFWESFHKQSKNNTAIHINGAYIFSLLSVLCTSTQDRYAYRSTAAQEKCVPFTTVHYYYYYFFFTFIILNAQETTLNLFNGRQSIKCSKLVLFMVLNLCCEQ